MNRIALVAAAFAFLLLLSVSSVSKFALAHTTKKYGNIELEVGWGSEPNLVGQPNTIFIAVSENGTALTNALANMEVKVKKGGITRTFDLVPGEKAGEYEADIIPSQEGKVSVILSGKIKSQNITDEIPIEDVESTDKVCFPTTCDQSDSGVPPNLKNTLSDLALQVEQAQAGASEAINASQNSVRALTDVKAAVDRSYLFVMVGVGVGVAGIVIAATALRKK